MDHFDAVELEILRTRLMNIQDEADAVVRRTAFSTALTAAKDFGSTLTDHFGNALAGGAEGLAHFSICLPRTMKSLLKVFPPDTWKEGDHLITNDAWLVLGHFGDICVATPVFYKSRLVAFAINSGHTADMGGTLNWAGAQEAYEEALQIPPLKLYSAGVIDSTLVGMIRANVRVPDQVMGDFQALINGNLTSARLVRELMEEHALDDLSVVAEAFKQQGQAAMRRMIASVPDGRYQAEVDMDGARRPLKLRISIVVEGDHLTVDYAGSPEQLERGGVNVPVNKTFGETLYALLLVLFPSLQEPEGAAQCVTLKAPDGSIFNCRYPASTWGRVTSSSFIHPAMHSALAQVIPEKVQAGWGFHHFQRMWGERTNGETFAASLLDAGGQGAMNGRDGAHALAFTTQAGNIPVEFFEARCPAQFERKEFRQDSGGAGKFRGGCGLSFTIRPLPEQTKPIKISILARNLRTNPVGLSGGKSGACARILIDGRVLPTDAGPAADGFVNLEPGQCFTLETAGGGGFGRPEERDPAQIERDIAYGYVSADYAREAYGFSSATRDE